MAEAQSQVGSTGSDTQQGCGARGQAVMLMLFRCMHTQAALGREAAFTDAYRHNRRMQLDGSLQVQLQPGFCMKCSADQHLGRMPAYVLDPLHKQQNMGSQC